MLVVKVLPDGQVEYAPRSGAQLKGEAQAVENSKELLESADEAVVALSPEERSVLATVQKFFALTGMRSLRGSIID